MASVAVLEDRADCSSAKYSVVMEACCHWAPGGKRGNVLQLVIAVAFGFLESVGTAGLSYPSVVEGDFGVARYRCPWGHPWVDHLGLRDHTHVGPDSL